MASGGARARSGPAPDPNALRRGRPGDEEWLTLPPGREGRAPVWPLPSKASPDEMKMWRRLWKKPQATQWERLDMAPQLAAYVVSFLESVDAGAPAGLKTAVLRMEAELGISLVGMRALRWKLPVDEVAEKREERASAGAQSARARLKAMS